MAIIYWNANSTALATKHRLGFTSSSCDFLRNTAPKLEVSEILCKWPPCGIEQSPAMVCQQQAGQRRGTEILEVLKGKSWTSSGGVGANMVLQGSTLLRNLVTGFISWTSHKYLRRLPASQSQEEKHALKERAREARTRNNHFTSRPLLQILLAVILLRRMERMDGEILPSQEGKKLCSYK